jgi:peptidyl-prolyl cis-trans isomerase C
MLRSLAVTAATAAALVLVGTAAAQIIRDGTPLPVAPAPRADPSIELLHSSKVKLTRGDYDTQLERLPPDARGGFGNNIDRINTLLRVILVDKTLSADARAQGLDKDPDIARRIAAETDRILAQAVMQRAQAQWEAEFDARPNLDEAARERWLVMSERYREPDQYQVTVLRYAFDKNGGNDGAREKANDARRRIAAGGDMTALAKSESDDPSAQTGGKLDWRTARSFDDSRLGRAVANLRQPGDLTRPIETDDAYYLIRLDAKRAGDKKPFDEVKAAIIADLRKEYVSTKLSEKMASIRNDPTIVVNQPAVDALVTRVDPSLLKPTMPMPADADEAPRARRGRGKGAAQ